VRERLGLGLLLRERALGLLGGGQERRLLALGGAELLAPARVLVHLEREFVFERLLGGGHRRGLKPRAGHLLLRGDKLLLRHLLLHDAHLHQAKLLRLELLIALELAHELARARALLQQHAHLLALLLLGRLPEPVVAEVADPGEA
jgi:hypothetical protein